MPTADGAVRGCWPYGQGVMLVLLVLAGPAAAETFRSWLILRSRVMAAETAVVVFPGYFVVDCHPLDETVPWPLAS